MAGLASVSFTRKDYEELKEAQRKLHDLRPLIDKFGLCGGDCSAWNLLADNLFEQLQAIEREFFPQPPQY